MKKLIAGNWKMNGTLDEARHLVSKIINGASVEEGMLNICDLLVCPPSIHMSAVRHACYGFPDLKFGSQDCSRYEDGAYTGDLSAKMLKDSGVSYVILGHSERRQYHGLRDEQVAQKAAQALKNDIIPIICIGETQDQREIGKEKDIIAAQLKGSLPKMKSFPESLNDIVIAYEPVWAIGTGKTASAADVEEMHTFIREELATYINEPEKIRILYGGSMKPENAKELLATNNVNGGLIGGASLNAQDFLAIARAA